MRPPMRWAYGVTTIPERFGTYLPRTLASLAQGGFDRPRIFADGTPTLPPQFNAYEATCRETKVGAWGNWLLGLQELVIREPMADRYALFQDDILAAKNLRQYLERCEYPRRGYWNCFTFRANNEAIVHSAANGWHLSDQYGRGALALVFDRHAAVEVLANRGEVIQKPFHADNPKKVIDAAVSKAMHAAGWQEYVHRPSLTQHMARGGKESSVGNDWEIMALTWMGEGWDALGLLTDS